MLFLSPEDVHFTVSLIFQAFGFLYSPQNQVADIHNITCHGFGRGHMEPIDQIGKNRDFKNIECSRR